MSMFQPAISARDSTRPRPYGSCAAAAPAEPSMAAATATTRTSIRSIAHLTVGRDAPGPHCIVVIKIVLATDGDQLGEAGLYIAGFIRCAALDDRRLAVPVPG